MASRGAEFCVFRSLARVIPSSVAGSNAGFIAQPERSSVPSGMSSGIVLRSTRPVSTATVRFDALPQCWYLPLLATALSH